MFVTVANMRDELGREFCIVLVKPEALFDKKIANDLIRVYTGKFGMPVVLAASNVNGLKFYGSGKIVSFLGSFPLEEIRWREQYIPRF